jgi:hypothetical protein
MTGSLRRSLITSKPRSHPATDGPASSGGDGGSGAVGWALLYRGLSRGLSQDARSRRRWAHPGCVLSTSGGGWQPGTALEQSPQYPKRAQALPTGSARMTGMKVLAALASAFMRRLWCRSGAYRGSAAARSPFTGGRAGFRYHLLEAFGVGLPLAVLLDATLIRGALLPAAMRLDGRATWWAPGPLHWLHARSGLREPTEHTPAPGSVCGPDGPIPPARSAHDGPSGRLRLVGSPLSRWPGHPTRAGRAWRLDRSARATYGEPVWPGRPADSSDSPSASLRQLGSPTGGYSCDRSHGASPGPTLPGSRSPTIQGPQWPRERR